MNAAVSLPMSTRNPLWQKAVYGVLILLVGALSLITLASLFSNYGVDWKHQVSTLIDIYHAVFYTVYDAFLDIILPRVGVHIHLTDVQKDIFTGFLFVFIASNLESLLRGKHFLLGSSIQYTKTIYAHITDIKTYTVQNYGMNRFFPTAKTVTICCVLFSFTLFIVEILFICSEFTTAVNEVYGAHSLQYYTCIFFVLSVTYLILFYFSTKLVRRTKSYIFTTSKKSKSATTALGSFAARRLIDVIYMLFALPVYLSGALLLINAALFSFVLSPILAWRTISLTALFFGALVLVNWAAMNQVI